MCLAAQCEQLFNQMRQGDDGRAGIEGEAILFVHISTATGHVELFKHLHLRNP
jgi:hypothetical protein